MKNFVIDIDHCSGCYCCQLACKDEHVGNDWTPYAKPEPITGQFWLKINETLRGTVPKCKMTYIPKLCMHCDEAPCIPPCPTKAIKKRPDGLVWIDPALCIGCEKCINYCPYQVIFFNFSLNIAQKCTGCIHILDRGWPIKVPRCSDACPHESIKFGEEADLSALIKQGVIFDPKLSATKPRVYYLGWPKPFVAGTVYDPSKEEIIENATCTLTGGGGTLTAKTDGFGDFWFKDLAVGTFSLKIEAAGKTKTIDPISTAKDVNLGDIALS